MGQYNKSHGSLKLYVDDKAGKRDVRPTLTVLTSKDVDASHGVLYHRRTGYRTQATCLVFSVLEGNSERKWFGSANGCETESFGALVARDGRSSVFQALPYPRLN